MEKNKNTPLPVRERSVTVLDGVGKKRAGLFEKMGISTVGQLLDTLPRAYQNRGNVHLLSQAAEEGVTCSVLLTVSSRPVSAILKNRMLLTKFTAFDDSGKATVSFFNSRFTEGVFSVGDEFRFWGKVKKTGGRYTLSSPEYERADLPDRPLADYRPVYPLTAGLTQNIFAAAVKSALDMTEDVPENEPIPDDLREKLGITYGRHALKQLHQPQSAADISGGRRYFSAKSALVFSASVALAGGSKRRSPAPEMNDVDMREFYGALGFTLTGAQKRSVDEIRRDMVCGEHAMSRLLSGDVGSGKTAVAAAAIYIAVKNGYQAGLMAPTEILASQHYAKLKPLFDRFGFRTALLTGSMTAKQKNDVRAELSCGTTDVIIGTHALLTDKTAFARPGLVVTDEQHRFGVSQRACLASGEGSPDVLVMSATPIPRTMALIMYGDLSVSTLDELPPGRQRIATFTVDGSYGERLLDFIRKQVGNGGAVYVVCPLVSPSDEDIVGPDLVPGTRLRSATETFEKLSAALAPDGISVGLVHGRQRPKEKDAVMNAFASGEIQVLVSTTVIEVGVDVPRATLMIITDAERFGLAQLHQLRGRVGRGREKSYCVLMSDSSGENARKRLEFMKNNDDGFKIAEFDLEIRGPGDYLPDENGRVRQHGEFAAVQCADMQMLKTVTEYVRDLVGRDPGLEGVPALKECIGNMIGSAERMMQ